MVDEALHRRSVERAGLDRDLALVESATLHVKSKLLAGLNDGAIEDLAFIGNASAVYPWITSLMVDLDVFLFAGRLDPALGHWLIGVREELTSELAERGADFELRIVEGPYKPAIRRLARPAIVAHLGVFTEAMYVAEAPLKRWAWRKYPCERETERLMRLAPAPPDLNEILNGDRGVRQRLRALRSGRIEMREWLLPDFSEAALYISREQSNFIECCFAYAANCARHHCRALGIREADGLSNEEFFPWYAANVLASPALSELMALKAQCRNTGFDVDAARVQTLAIEYMGDLDAILQARVTGRSAPS